MKILLFFILAGVIVIFMTAAFKKTDVNSLQSAEKKLIQEPMTEKYLYTNKKHKYQVLVPQGFEIDDKIPELVSIENMDMRLRINAGCQDFGVENLHMTVEPIAINGIPASKEDYYDDFALRLRRITLHLEDRECFALEEVAETETGWQELFKIRETFRFVD